MRRARSKSAYSERRRYESSGSDGNESQELNLSYFENNEENCEHDERPPNDEWSAADQMHLLRYVLQQIPQSDALPFEERVKKIKWKKVQIANKSIEDVQTEFQNILKSSRQFRLLNEIVREKQKEILPKLSMTKPLPAFILFMRDNKDKIIGDKMQAGKYTQIASKLFKKCDETERIRYRDMAAELKRKHEEDLAKYDLIDRTRPVSSKGIKTVKTASFKDGPIDFLIRNQKLQGINLTKVDARKQYASLDKTKKLELLLQWLGLEKGEKRNMEQYTKCKRILSNEDRKIFDDYEGKPKKLSGYNLFIADTFAKANLENSSSQSTIKSASQSWRNLSKKKREEYITKANKSNGRFTANIIRYVASLPLDRQEHEINSLSTQKNTTLKYKKKTVATYLNSERNIDSDLEDDENERIYQCQTAHSSPRINESDGVMEKEKRKELSKSLEGSQEISSFLSPGNSNQWPASQIFTQIPGSTGTQFENNTTFPKLSPNSIDMPILHVKSESDNGSGLADGEYVKNVRRKILNSPEKQTKLFSPEISSRRKKRSEESDQSSANETLNQSFFKDKNKKRKLNENVTPSKSTHTSFTVSTPTEWSISKPDIRKYFISPIPLQISTETKEKYEKLLSKRPPDDIIKYYAQQSFNGSRKKAIKHFVRMSESEKDELDTAFQKTLHKYKKKLHKFTESLKPSEQTAIKAHLEST